MQLEHKNVAPGIDLFSNCLDGKWLVDYIEEECSSGVSELTWDSSYTGTGLNSSYRTSLSCNLDPINAPSRKHELAEKLRSEIFKRVETCVDSYCDIYRIKKYISEEYIVLKYSNGAQYRSHYDDGPTTRRNISVVSCLSNNSDGGEIAFPFFDVELKLKEGDVLVFPSNFMYLHYAKPVHNGVKYSLVTWFL